MTTFRELSTRVLLSKVSVSATRRMSSLTVAGRKGAKTSISNCRVYRDKVSNLWECDTRISQMNIHQYIVPKHLTPLVEPHRLFRALCFGEGRPRPPRYEGFWETRVLLTPTCLSTMQYGVWWWGNYDGTISRYPARFQCVTDFGLESWASEMSVCSSHCSKGTTSFTRLAQRPIAQYNASFWMILGKSTTRCPWSQL